jgi:5'-phosphate synthase pdxT subunit
VKRIGVLALQGDFEAHRRALAELGVDAPEVRTASELENLDALVIPGGESTTMLKLLGSEKMLEPLRAFGGERPIFGTCAGAILLACEVRNPSQESLGLVDISVERNAYGRQVDSRVTTVQLEPAFAAKSGRHQIEAVFIRAPIIRRTGDGVRVLARYQGDPVLVEQGRHLLATFHPELSSDRLIHRYFLERVESWRS